MISSPAMFRMVTAAALLALSACGSGAAATPGSATDPAAAPQADGSSLRAAPPEDAPPPREGVESTITFSEWKWIREQTGAISDLELPDGSKRRVLSGDFAWRNVDGSIVFTQGCGQNVSRIAVADPLGKVTVATPCSSDVSNPGHSPTLFEFARSSPSGARIAVEARYYVDGRFQYSTLVYEHGQQLQVFDGHWAPTWLDEDTVLLSSDGLYAADIGNEPVRLDDGSLSSGPNNPDIDPAGERVVFEWNQQIWMMNLDGSGLEELVSGPSQYRFPAFAPDGSAIAFLATGHEDLFDEAIYVLDLESREFTTIDLSGQLGETHVPRGPLSWRAPAR